MKKTVGLILHIFLLISLAGCGSSNTSQPSDGSDSSGDYTTLKYDIRIGSASTGSVNQVLMTGMSSIATSHSALSVSALTTKGSTENVRLLRDKEIEIAAINGDTAYMAWTGTGNFKKGDLDGMSQLFSTFSNQALFVTREGSGIKRIEDLAGKKVAVGAAGSGAADLAYSILYYGYDMWDDKINIQYMSYTDEVEALKDGTIDAMVAHLNSGAPASYFAELDITCGDLVLMEVSDEAIAKIQEAQPFQRSQELTTDNCTLNNLGDESITVMENYALIYTRNDIPEDVIYAFVRTVLENAHELDTYHTLGAGIRTENALKGVFADIPVHPGAIAYYKEAGIWDDSFHAPE